MPTNLKLTPEQQTVSDAIVDFALGKTSVPYIAIAGYAGTGKTTVMGVSAHNVLKVRNNMRIAYCAPTGKAASVLENKLQNFGGTNAFTSVKTIHGHIYRLNMEKTRGRPVFDLKAHIDMPYDLIVVDEASMVTPTMMRDILQFGIPTVFIGDSGQLPPVEGELFFPLRETPYVLKTVHRQALENPIVRWATEVRLGGKIPYTSSSTFARIKPRTQDAIRITNRFMTKARDANCMILCGKNATRVSLNKRARTMNNLSGKLPLAGEKLVCLKNMPNPKIFNGQIFTVVQDAVTCTENDTCYKVVLQLTSTCTSYPIISYAGALDCKSLSDVSSKIREDSEYVDACMEWSLSEEPAMFSYGYVCSVHKAQGSEWDNVLLLNEILQGPNDSAAVVEENHRRWMYTGMTRAREKLCIIG